MKYLNYFLGPVTAMIVEGDDSNESTESSNVILGFRGFGASSPGPSTQLSAGLSQSSSQGVWDPNERIRNAHSILKLMCDSAALVPYFHQLLSEKYVTVVFLNSL